MCSWRCSHPYIESPKRGLDCSPRNPKLKRLGKYSKTWCTSSVWFQVVKRGRWLIAESPISPLRFIRGAKKMEKRKTIPQNTFGWNRGRRGHRGVGDGKIERRKISQLCPSQSTRGISGCLWHVPHISLLRLPVPTPLALIFSVLQKPWQWESTPLSFSTAPSGPNRGRGEFIGLLDE